MLKEDADRHSLKGGVEPVGLLGHFDHQRAQVPQLFWEEVGTRLGHMVRAPPEDLRERAGRESERVRGAVKGRAGHLDYPQTRCEEVGIVMSAARVAQHASKRKRQASARYICVHR